MKQFGKKKDRLLSENRNKLSIKENKFHKMTFKLQKIPDN